MRRSTLGEVARYLAIGAAVVVFISLFLPSFSSGDNEDGQSFFEFYTRYDIVLALLCVLAVVLAIVDRFVRANLLPLAGAIGFFLLSDPAFILCDEFGGTLDKQSGFYLHLLGALTLSATTLMSLLADSAGARQPTSAMTTSPPPPPPPPPSVAPQRPPSAPTAGPPAHEGWYPDPLGQTNERYWSGSSWTDQTR